MVSKGGWIEGERDQPKQRKWQRIPSRAEATLATRAAHTLALSLRLALANLKPAGGDDRGGKAASAKPQFHLWGVWRRIGTKQ